MININLDQSFLIYAKTELFDHEKNILFLEY